MAKVKKEKVNLNTVSQAHGAIAPTKSIQEILGYTSIYKEASLEEYQETINKMDDIDLHQHAIDMDVVPGHHKARLIDELERKFINAKNRYIGTTAKVNVSRENEESLRKILRGGI